MNNKSIEEKKAIAWNKLNKKVTKALTKWHKQKINNMEYRINRNIAINKLCKKCNVKINNPTVQMIISLYDSKWNEIHGREYI